MTQTQGQNWQSVQEAALVVLGKVARSTNEAITSAIDNALNTPLRMYPALVPDAKIYFAASRPVDGDGGSKATPAQDDLIPSFPASSLNFQTGATTGGTFYRDGVAFTRPPSTTGQYRRCAFVYRGDNIIDCTFSAEVASYGSLADPGSLFALIEGIPLGWIDLVGTTTNANGAWKTASSAGSSATSVIEAAVSGASAIFRIASGGGAGGGAVKDFKIGSVTDSGSPGGALAIIKGGYLKIDDARELATYIGSGGASTDYGRDLTVDLDAILGSNPANATAYYLYIDLQTLGSQVTLSDNGRKVYGIVQANLVLSTTSPESRDPRRYVPIGVIRSADSGTVWSGTGSKFSTMAIRHHETLTRFFAYPETFVDETITTAVALNTLSHNLSGEPHALYLTYDDGSTEIGLDLSAHLLDVTATQIKISSLGLTFGGGQKLRVRAVRFPQQSALASLSRTFTSGWYTDTATITVPHSLNDAEDVRGYEVQEWNTSTGKIRNIDRSALVVNFDATNFYLDWTGLTPSATLKYRIVAGGSPLPYAVPTQFGGYTKFVGIGPGSYATVTAALAAATAGDRILILRDTTESATLTIPAGVAIFQMPGTTVSTTATSPAVLFSGAKGKWEGMNVQLNPAGALAIGVSITAADCWVTGWVELNTAQTVTDLLNVSSGGTRTYAQLGVKKTLGTITNLETNLDGAGKTDVWGG